MKTLTKPLSVTKQRRLLHGCHVNILDRKGRIVFPPDFRTAFAAEEGVPWCESLFLTLGEQGVLVAFPSSRFPTYAQRWLGDPKEVLLHLASARECSVDFNTARVLIPYELREHAGLKPYDRVALAGVGDGVLILKADELERRLRDAQGAKAPVWLDRAGKAGRNG